MENKLDLSYDVFGILSKGRKQAIKMFDELNKYSILNVENLVFLTPTKKFPTDFGWDFIESRSKSFYESKNLDPVPFEEDIRNPLPRVEGKFNKSNLAILVDDWYHDGHTMHSSVDDLFLLGYDYVLAFAHANSDKIITFNHNPRKRVDLSDKIMYTGVSNSKLQNIWDISRIIHDKYYDYNQKIIDNSCSHNKLSVSVSEGLSNIGYVMKRIFYQDENFFLD